MKRPFVQCAKVVLEPDGDPAAPGGAVTLALCGSWDHTGPCRWPHHTAMEPEGEQGNVRVVFAADAGDEARVRALIDQALAGGECVGPDGKVTRWVASQLCTDEIRPGEAVLAASLVSAPVLE